MQRLWDMGMRDETCNDIPISKLQNVNKCPGVYFVCKTWQESTIGMDPETTEKTDELKKLVSKLQTTEKSLLEQIHNANREIFVLELRLKIKRNNRSQAMYQGKPIIYNIRVKSLKSVKQILQNSLTVT